MIDCFNDCAKHITVEPWIFCHIVNSMVNFGNADVLICVLKSEAEKKEPTFTSQSINSKLELNQTEIWL